MAVAQDTLILVDAHDRIIEPLDKATCHDGDGRRHRAFSVFIFDQSGKLLIQQRSPAKRLWPGFWSNSCCSHPRWGETVFEAAERRPKEELGLVISDLTYLYKFEYQASYEDKGSEWELCHVLFARTATPVKAEPEEVAAWRFVEPRELSHALRTDPTSYTPWLKLEWQHLETHFAEAIKAYSQPQRECQMDETQLAAGH